MMKVALIGAGIAGLGMAKSLKEKKIPYDHFEKMPELGGNWKYGVYENVHIISSKKTTEYPEFPMPVSYPDFPNSTQMLAYLRSFAGHFDLESSIQFNSSVRSIVPEGDNWRLELEGGGGGIYHSVIVANGHHWHTRYPKIPGEFTGEIFHSKDYKSPDCLKGKRVLVVGAGNSALDLAVDAGEFAMESHISMRTGRWIIPKTFFGIPSVDVMQPWFPKPFTRNLVKTLIFIQFGRYGDYGIPEPRDEIFERHPTVNSQFLYFMKHGKITPHVDLEKFSGKEVIFKDGSRLEVDTVIFATGFHASLPMLSSLNLKYNTNGMPELIYGMFPKDYKNLYILGMGQPRYGAGPLVSKASELISLLILKRGEFKKPIGHTIGRLGAMPLEREALDPFEVLDRVEKFRGFIPFLPILEKALDILPENIFPGSLSEIKKKYIYPPPTSVSLKNI